LINTLLFNKKFKIDLTASKERNGLYFFNNKSNHLILFDSIKYIQYELYSKIFLFKFLLGISLLIFTLFYYDFPISIALSLLIIGFLYSYFIKLKTLKVVTIDDDVFLFNFFNIHSNKKIVNLIFSSNTLSRFQNIKNYRKKRVKDFFNFLPIKDFSNEKN
jgi:hypothetical protein